jgi:hypothetical protein
MGMNLLIYIEKILDKLQSILHTLAGWVVAILLFLADFIVGHELAVGLVVFVTLMDAVWGITVSVKKKRFALSELARLTIGKLAVYGCAMLVLIDLDKMIDMTLSTTRSIGFIGNGITPMWNNAEYGMHFSRVGSSTDYGTRTIPADLGVIE